MSGKILNTFEVLLIFFTSASIGIITSCLDFVESAALTVFVGGGIGVVLRRTRKLENQIQSLEQEISLMKKAEAHAQVPENMTNIGVNEYE